MKEAIVRRFAQMRDRSYLRWFGEYKNQLRAQRDKVYREPALVREQFEEARDFCLLFMIPHMSSMESKEAADSYGELQGWSLEVELIPEDA